MSRRNHLPATVDLNLDARVAAFCGVRPALEDLDVENSRSVAPRPELPAPGSVFGSLKLLFAALGAGNRVVPLGDNGRTARLLAEYAAALRTH